MYGLPEGFDGAVFLQKTLEQICFSVNTVNLYFDDSVFIVIGGPFSYQDESMKDPKIISLPIFESNLMRLLGNKIVHVDAKRNGTLSLTFDNECIITCLDMDPQYESYNIHIGETRIIV